MKPREHGLLPIALQKCPLSRGIIPTVSVCGAQMIGSDPREEVAVQNRDLQTHYPRGDRNRD